MAKKNLPNIPIYVGDWERDCNVLSLKAEAAWLRIIFKMWLKGKQSVYKLPTKSLQNLWRVSSEEMHEIIEELKFNEICEILEKEGFVEFKSRRFQKENELSEKRSKAVSNRKDRPTRSQQKTYKYHTKDIQNTDIDIENENEDDNKKRESEREKIEFKFDSKKMRSAWNRWKSYRKSSHKFKYHDALSEQRKLRELENMASSEDEAIAIIDKSITEGWKGFWKPEKKKKTVEWNV